MAKHEWLLSDRDIREIAGEASLAAAADGDGGLKIVALVQDAKTKQKMVEWITSMGNYAAEVTPSTFRIPGDEWEALRSELGLSSGLPDTALHGTAG